MGSGLKEGQIVQITCNIISGDPPIYFSWLKDGMKLPASLKVCYIFYLRGMCVNFRSEKHIVVGFLVNDTLKENKI